MRFKVAPPPRMADCLIGMPDMHRMDALPHVASQRVHTETTKEQIFTDFLQAMHQRRRCRPLRILSVCDGLATGLVSIMEAGFRTEEYRAVEVSPKRRLVAASNFPGMINHVSPHDVTHEDIEVAVFADGFVPDLFFCTSRCGAWSRARINPPPMGFAFYEEEGNTYGGYVTAVRSEDFTVHDWGPLPNDPRKYLPLWITSARGAPQRGPLKQPPGAKPHTTAVLVTALFYVGSLTETQYLTEVTVDAMRARGVELEKIV
jgi:hypothetical protein